jgi:hypothetical protein
LVEQLNEILGDPSWWNVTRRADAERRFDPIVVAAFFDNIQAGKVDSWSVREDQIPLPGREEGYARVMFVGTTGAGKTTLLRHLIGSDHEKDRFPSTSTAKTTVSDIEIVLVEGDYEAVVTFSSEHEVLANIEECVADACVAVFEGRSDGEVAERLLNHRDQRFRLSYTLGSYPKDVTRAAPVDSEFSFDEDEDETDDDDAVSSAERDANGHRLKEYIERLRGMHDSLIDALSVKLEEDIAKLSGQDRDAAQELFEADVWEAEDFSNIVQDILGDVRNRFELLSHGELTRNLADWPERWHLKSADRDEFIRAVRWFASNYAVQFGRLLTPLVDGIRVSGPLFPSFTSEHPRLVLLDGQGLGHTPESSSSVTTQITRRYGDVDIVLLVDNAQQPMQAAPLSVLRSIATSGHQQKLAIAFTHFDNVRGANLPDFTAKRAHVMASVTNALSNLRDALGGASIVRAIEQNISDRSFMLGGLDRAGEAIPKGFQKELVRLIAYCEKAVEPPAPPVAHPEYHFDGLPLAVQAASRAFQRPWLARLGLTHHESVSKEHWTRIKALNRRVAGELNNYEYDSLRPVAELLARLTEEVSRFLSNPARWVPATPSEEEAEAALDLIRQRVHSEFHSLASRRLVQDQLDAWRGALELKGVGSTFDRAQELRLIYEGAAPVPTAAMTEISAKLMSEVRRIVVDAVENSGARSAA